MTLIYALTALFHLMASLPLLLGIFCGYKYRKCPEVSGRLILMLSLVSVASLGGLFNLPTLLSMQSSNVLLLLGSVATSVVGLAFLVRRFRFFSLVWLIPVMVIAELAILAVVDNRFRIVVQDADGVAVDVEDDEMAIGHAWNLFGGSGITIRKGTKRRKGEYYFGLLVWLRCKDEWRFCGRLWGADGNYLGDLEWKPATWEEWPKYVVVNQRTKE